MSSIMVEMPIMVGARKGAVLTVPCEPHSTFGDIHMFLQSKLGKKEMSVYLQGRGEQGLGDEDFASKTLRESMCLTSPIPVFLYEPGEGFPVYVKLLTGKRIEITVDNTWSVKDLKERISMREGVPIGIIIFAGQQLEDAHKLREYVIHANSTIHLVLRLRGGGFVPKFFKLVDVSNDEARVDRAWSKNAPRWRCAAPGFTIEGICENIECDAYCCSVICIMNFGCFNMNTAVPYCPMCRRIVDCENIGFNNCFYKIRCVKMGSNAEISMPWTKAGDRYRTWDKDKAGMVEWEHMEIIARKLETAKAVPGVRFKEAPVAEKCAICFRHLAGQQDALMLRCSHSYHEGCWEGWSDISRSKGCKITCPLCRVVIEEI